MHWVSQVQAAVDYLEAHLEGTVQVEEAAQAAGISAYQFQRAFSVLADMTVQEYVRFRRLTLAAQEMAFSDRKVIDVALQFGYETPEAFTKAFRKVHGASPTEVRSRQKPWVSYNPLSITIKLEGRIPMNVRVESHEKIVVQGVVRRFSNANQQQQQEIPLFWGEVHRDGIVPVLQERNTLAPQGLVGVCSDFDPVKQEMSYWIGAACRDQDETAPFDRLVLPAATYAIFEVVGPMPQAIQEVWGRIYSEWFPSNPYQPSGGAELEVYPMDDPEKADFYSEIWIPVKAKNPGE